MRFETLAFHLVLTFDAILLPLSQSVIWQNSREYAGMKLDAATRAKTDSVWLLDISTAVVLICTCTVSNDVIKKKRGRTIS